MPCAACGGIHSVFAFCPALHCLTLVCLAVASSYAADTLAYVMKAADDL